MRAKKIFTLCCTFVFLCSFCSCFLGSSDDIFRYDLGADPKNLDPQMAYDTPSFIVLNHVMEGLLKLDENGIPQPAAAESYSISADQLTYTFHLRNNMTWSNGSSLTADDFIFGLQRNFLPETQAPNQSAFLCIKNAPEVLNQELPVDALGIKKINDTTIAITLSYPSAAFIEALASPAAFPCDEVFFYKTKGKYGFDTESLLYNGPYQITDWTLGRYILLRKNTAYHSADSTLTHSINFYTNTTLDAQNRLLEKETDVSLISRDAIEQFSKEGFEIYSFENKTWMLGFNQAVPIFQNMKIRTALSLCLKNITQQINASEHYTYTTGILPPDITVNGTSYRKSFPAPVFSSQQNPRLLLEEGLKELGLRQFPKISVICPDEPLFKYYLTYAQQAWQKELGIIINFVPESDEAYARRMRNTDFDIAIFSLQAEQQGTAYFLEKFTTDSIYNYLNLKNSEFDRTINSITSAKNFQQVFELTKTAEKLLLDQAVVVPIAHEKSYAASTQNSGIQISPFGPSVNFINAQKE